MKIKPTGSRILVLVDEDRKMTDGGLHLPDQAREKQAIGKVLAVGPGKYNDNGTRQEMCVKVGDRVIFGRFAGNAVPESVSKIDQRMILVETEEIYAVLE